jgi:hypothetical protein
MWLLAFACRESRQPVLQAAYDLAGAPQGERDCVPKDFSSCHGGLEHI